MSLEQNKVTTVQDQTNDATAASASKTVETKEAIVNVKTNTTKPEKTNNTEQNVIPLNLEERIVQIKRISKTTKGGRIMRFSALVVVGDKKGTVGFGMGKSNEVPDAIKKAIKNANNNLVTIKMNKRGTVFHELLGKHGASVILLKPAPEGKGIVAGGAARAVVELAGFQDIYTKSLRSNCPINVIRATINGLTKQFSPSKIAKARDKQLTDF